MLIFPAPDRETVIEHRDVGVRALAPHQVFQQPGVSLLEQVKGGHFAQERRVALGKKVEAEPERGPAHGFGPFLLDIKTQIDKRGDEDGDSNYN
jgi:hypothetical protein